MVQCASAVVTSSSWPRRGGGEHSVVQSSTCNSRLIAGKVVSFSKVTTAAAVVSLVEVALTTRRRFLWKTICEKRSLGDGGYLGHDDSYFSRRGPRDDCELFKDSLVSWCLSLKPTSSTVGGVSPCSCQPLKCKECVQTIHKISNGNPTLFVVFSFEFFGWGAHVSLLTGKCADAQYAPPITPIHKDWIIITFY